MDGWMQPNARRTLRMNGEPRYMAKLTGRARDVLHVAAQEAIRCGRRTVAAEMLLIALLSEERSAASVTLEAEGVSREDLRDSLRDLFPIHRRSTPAEPVWNHRLRRALDEAFEAAKRLKNPYIGSEHLLIGVTRGLSRKGSERLAQAGVTPDALEERIRALGAQQRVEEGAPDRWNELLKAELAEKLKEIDLDEIEVDIEAEVRPASDTAPRLRRLEASAPGWKYRAIAVGGEAGTPERLAREVEEALNRQMGSGWEYVDLVVSRGPGGPVGLLILRRRV